MICIHVTTIPVRLAYLETLLYLFSECQRFLRAVKWDLPSAFNRAEETVVWRREFEVEKINENPDMIDEEGKTGKEVIMGVSSLSSSDTDDFAEPVYRLSSAFFSRTRSFCHNPPPGGRNYACDSGICKDDLACTCSRIDRM